MFIFFRMLPIRNQIIAGESEMHQCFFCLGSDGCLGVCTLRPDSSSVIHVPGVNDIQPSGSSNQNLAQISRQLNPGQVAWSGNRPPFSGQVSPWEPLWKWRKRIHMWSHLTACSVCSMSVYVLMSIPIHLIHFLVGNSTGLPMSSPKQLWLILNLHYLDWSVHASWPCFGKLC